MKSVAGVIAIILMSTPLWAQDWRPLEGAEIVEALNGRALIYENGDRQDFSASGETLYFAAGPSKGYWGVRDGQYCSVWPPSDIWTCYDLERSAQGLRFVGKHGDITTGRYLPE